MKISLIVTTYNRKDALKLVLWSAIKQTVPPMEILIADDGSSDGTDSLVAEVHNNTLINIIHCWQVDMGFRAARGRNLAIAAATGDYLVFVDGDMILEKSFLEDHQRAAQKGYFIQGGRVLFDEIKTKKVIHDQTLTLSWWEMGVRNRKNCLRSRFLATIFSTTTTKLAGIRTCNFAAWKDDVVAINGFNENFIGWGREDSEFAARLLHSGVNRKNLRFQAVAYHLFHGLQQRSSLKENDAILHETLMKKLTWCSNGLDQHIMTGAPTRREGANGMA